MRRRPRLQGRLLSGAICLGAACLSAFLAVFDDVALGSSFVNSFTRRQEASHRVSRCASQKGTNPRVRAGRALNKLKDAARSGKLKLAEKCFKELVELDMADMMTITSVITAAAKVGDLETAEKYFELIEVPDVTAYSAVLSVAARAGKMEAAEEWFDRMREDGVKPHRIAYRTMLNAAATAGDQEALNKWLSRMKEARFDPDAVTYNVLMKAAKIRGDFPEVLQWYEKMLKDGLKADSMIFTTIVTTAARNATLSDARQWFDKAFAAKVPVDRGLYNAMLNAYSAAGDVKGAEGIFADMAAKRVKQYDLDYTCLMKCYAKAELPDKVENVWQRMLDNGISPNKRACFVLRQGVSEERFLELTKDLKVIQAYHSFDRFRASSDSKGQTATWEEEKTATRF
eukprot:TRINITY_DN39653_c0_g1_i2.p1 TRINITY_DN39653_c0_g1~~TRINITY_DN39653_c0_g1_i2.p1  ORF type:complete len:400 (+),score=79.87 TRINITY_DN39653_c0_g1_i2:70-1269(+)